MSQLIRFVSELFYRFGLMVTGRPAPKPVPVRVRVNPYRRR